MPAIIRPFTNYMLKTSFGKNISTMSTIKLGLYTTGTAFTTLGFYRGFQHYYISELKDKKNKIIFKDYACCIIFGFIGASIYINPSICSFALYNEYMRATLILSGADDKTIAESNILFNICGNKCK